MRKYIFYILCVLFIPCSLGAKELVYMDKKGTIRWVKDKKEVALFGANYCIASACDYRAAQYVGGDHKEMIREDLIHFNKMGWEALRLCFWGDFQNTDIEGNLIENVHLDLFCYLIAEATRKNIYMLLSPIVTYSSQWPDMMHDTSNMGFANHYQKNILYNDEKAVQVQENYMGQLLEYRNPYTGLKIKEEPNILFIELINEPTQHPYDIEGLVKYINRLHDAVRNTGCEKITFYNVSQDYRVAPAIKESKVQGSTHAWYPTALNNGYTLPGNNLLFVDRYEQMLDKNLDGKAKLVYEFDCGDIEAGYMLPAMTREYRRGGIQFATFFSYDMLRTAHLNLGWQTHYINMVYTPSKAVGGMIAAEVMKQIPMGKHFGYYPENNVFGDFRVSYEEDLAELTNGTQFYYSNHTNTQPKNVEKLRRIVGVGSSPVVQYDGTGIYFLDKQPDGLWRLEVYPDIVTLDDPYKMVSPTRPSKAAIRRARTMTLSLPGVSRTFSVEPGVYLIGEDVVAVTDPEFIAPETQIDKWHLFDKTPKQAVVGEKFRFQCEAFGLDQEDEVYLYIKHRPWGISKLKMESPAGYMWEVEVDETVLPSGRVDYHFSIENGEKSLLYPALTKVLPDKWDYYKQDTYTLRAVNPSTPLLLFDADADYTRIRKTRTFNSPVNWTELQTGETELKSAVRLFVEDLAQKEEYAFPCDATISYYIGDRIQLRSWDACSPKSIRVKIKSDHTVFPVMVTLVDKEGRGYGRMIDAGTAWDEASIPVHELKPEKAVMLPQDWPAVNSYYYPLSLTSYLDKFDWKDIEFIQFSMREEFYPVDDLKNKGFLLQDVVLVFE